MARKKRKQVKQPSKFVEDAMIVTTKIVEIEELNKPFDNRYKSVFYCESQKSETPVMCIFWKRTTISVGDTVSLKGRLNQNTFLAWDVQIIKSAEAEKESING